MGDNDFIAGDPWGLPIEDSEDVEIEVARPDDEEGAPQPQSDLEAGPDDEEEPVFSAEGETDFEGQGSHPAGPAPDEPTGVEEPEAGSDVRWSSEEPEPVASGYEVATEETPDLDEEAEGKEEEYTFRAPSRTPLSQMIAAAQTTSNYQFDDSRLGHVKELIANLKTRMEVAEKLVNAEINFHDEIPLDKSNAEDIVDQVTEYFTPSDTTVKVASSVK